MFFCLMHVSMLWAAKYCGWPVLRRGSNFAIHLNDSQRQGEC
jgi:hypothetical protein